jgi:uncharacterized protein YuzE
MVVWGEAQPEEQAVWVRYDEETDILHIRLDAGAEKFRNEVYSDELFEVVFDIDGEDRIAGIDILDASKRVNLGTLPPMEQLGSPMLPSPIHPKRAEYSSQSL